jgi:hypothetical protein
MEVMELLPSDVKSSSPGAGRQAATVDAAEM